MKRSFLAASSTSQRFLKFLSAAISKRGGLFYLPISRRTVGFALLASQEIAKLYFVKDESIRVGI